MIIVRLIGRLGNQMFQYASAPAVAYRMNLLLKLDVTRSPITVFALTSPGEAPVPMRSPGVMQFWKESLP